MDDKAQIETSLHSINVKNCDPEKTAFEAKKTENRLILEVPEDNNKFSTAYVASGTLMSIQDMMKDLLQGDTSILERPEFTILNFNNIIKALEWLSNNNLLQDTTKNLLLTEGWRINYRCKPPKPEEFLTEQYIGAQAESLYPCVKEILLESMNQIAPYDTIVLSGCIGLGKSTMSVIINLYMTVLFALMWHPFKYFGLAPSTIFTQVYAAVSQKKASELLFEPMINLLSQSPYFLRVRTDQEVREISRSTDTPNTIAFTSSSPSSVLSFQNGANYKLISKPGGLLGQTIITGTFTELAFFTDDGWTDEKILKFFTKLRQRISSRMKGNWMGKTIIDSSPNTLESVIDKWIWEDAPKSKKNYIVTGSRWRFFKESEFPEFYDENGNEIHNFKVAFPLFKGGNGMLPKVIESEFELTQYDPIDVLWCPKRQITGNGISSFIDKANENPIEFMRDFAGIPAGSADRIFYNQKTIEACFDNKLRNVLKHITAPAEEEPEHLIWNQIRDQFFVRVLNNWYFYYEPHLMRAISVDQSTTGDSTCIAMSHVEYDPDRIDESTGEPLKVFVTDFTIMIIPKGGIINLDAIKFFIYDLMTLGNISIGCVSYDGFQSDASRQFLKRMGINVDYLSVDKQNEPYMNFIDYVFHGRFNVGRNIHVKNNMKSIQMTKRKQTGTTKIDHMKGNIVHQDDSPWELNQIGINAKDALDAVVGSLYLINKYSEKFVPYKKWNPNFIRDTSSEGRKESIGNVGHKMGLLI